MITLNNYQINPTIFPDGTQQVWKIPEEILSQDNYVIYWDYRSDSEIFTLVQLKLLLNKPTTLKIKQLPYARQDEYVSNETTFGLTALMEILKICEFTAIEVTDPHSELFNDVMSEFTKVTEVYPISTINMIVDWTAPDVLCYPDKGAKEKYSKIYQHNFIYANKIRDQQSGEILKVEIVGEVPKKVLIVDDICDGGMTFIKLSELLHEKGAEKVSLFVTHGIFSKGLRVLKDAKINAIYTIDGEVSEYRNQITIKLY